MENPSEELKSIAILESQGLFFLVEESKCNRIAEQMALRLQHPAIVIPDSKPEDKTDLYLAQFKAWLSKGVSRFVVVPMGSKPVDQNPICLALAWLRREIGNSPFSPITIFIANAWTPSEFAEVIQDSLAGDHHFSRDVDPDMTPDLLLVGEGQVHVESERVSQEITLTAHALKQLMPHRFVGYSFLQNTFPTVDEVLSQRTDSVSRVCIIPWQMTESAVQHLQAVLPTNSSQKSVILNTIRVTDLPSIIHILFDKYLAALSRRSLDRYIEFDISTEPSQATFNVPLMELEEAIDSMLPSEYRGRTEEVRASSMGSATLSSDAMGQVEWDKIWTSFCDLAMAGGPPHRGTLLEAVTREQAESQVEAYQQVAMEIRRGIEMVTGLTTTESTALGWIGVVCDSEAMACWLMRAIIVENVMVRREGATLYLPAGPNFRVKREIKNVITSVAKTVHYWRAHLRMRNG